MSRHPYGATIAVVVTAGWAAASLPILAARGAIPGGSILDWISVDTEKVAVLAVMAVLAPAAAWITSRADGRDRLRLIADRLRHWRIGLRSWLLAIVALPATTVGIGVMAGRDPRLSPGVFFEQLLAVAIAVLAVNLLEEAVWAGLVQSRLEVRHRIAMAALLTAIPFALVHLPLRFVEGDFSVVAAAGQLGALVVLGFVVRLLIALVQRRVDDSILAVAVFHAAFNSSNNEDGIGAAVLGRDHQGYALLAVVLLLVVTAAGSRARLRRRDAARERVLLAADTALAARPVAGLAGERPQRSSEQPATTVLGRRLVKVAVIIAGFALHAVAGVFVSASGLFMPLWAVAAMAVAWLIAAGFAIRHWRRPPVVLAAPAASFAIWYATSWVGGALLGWTP